MIQIFRLKNVENILYLEENTVLHVYEEAKQYKGQIATSDPIYLTLVEDLDLEIFINKKRCELFTVYGADYNYIFAPMEDVVEVDIFECNCGLIYDIHDMTLIKE